MRKITSLLMLLLCFVGAVNAEVTKYYKPGERLTTLTEGQKVMFYNTCLPDGQERTGFLIDNAGNFALNKQKPSAAPIFSEKVGVWTLENVTNTDGVYTVNVKGANGYVGIGGKTNNAAAQVLRFQEWTAADAGKKAGVNSENAAGTKVNNADISAEDKVWLVTNADQSTTWNGNQTSFATWSTGHPYAIYSVVEATTEDLEAMLATAKETAVNELNTLKQLSAIYTTAESAIANVNAVALENNDLETALNTINTLVANVKAEVNGKNVKFCNKATDGRGGRYLGYDVADSRFAALMSDDDNVVWTLKHQGNGTFKLYNAVNNVWLGQPDKPAGPAADEAAAVAYTFVITAENVVCLVPNGTSKMVHINNSANENYPVMNYYSTTDAASLWNVTVISSKEVTNASYTTFVNSKKTVLDGFITYAKQLQDNYGLVKDGANLEVVINHPSGSDCQPSSNLLDGDNGTFVHSSYASGANEVTHHYIKAHLSEAKQKVFFYLSKRNNNNRPLKVNVYASNTADEYPTTPAATLIMTESQDNSIQSYFTEAIDLGAAYEYLKFEVVNTNTNTQYFTLSEFYILPVLEETTKNVSDLTSTSVFANNADACLTAANEYYSTLKLPELKAEIAAFLEANEDKVADMEAEKPELGQYPYGIYMELKLGLDQPNVTLEDLQNAFETFKKSKNLPVFMITGPKDYVVGKSIYDDPERVNAKGNTLYFKTTNIYDKTMWWAMDITETTVGATHLNKEIALYNVGTGKDFWNSSIKLTETNENEGVGIATDDIFLMYTTSDASYPVHFQADGALMTRWGSYDVASGSAMKFVYVGNSYDLNQLPNSLFTAAAELAAVSVPNFSFAAGMNSYNEATKPALDAAVANRTTVLSKLSTAEELDAAKAQLETAIDGVQLNMPVNGKFYRVRCADKGTGMRRLQSTINNDRLQMISGDAGINVNSIFCYVDGGLLSYTVGKYINAYSFNDVGIKSGVAFSKAYNGELGQYNIKINDDRYIYGKKDEIDSGTGTPSDQGYNWWLEEVTEIPVTIGTAGASTLYAPVALTLPELSEGQELKVYTAIQDGDCLMLNEVTGVIPANTGVILMGTAATYNFTISDDASDPVGQLTGTVATKVNPNDGTIYTLQKPSDAFVMKKYNGANLNGFKAYYVMPAESNVQALRLSFGETTGIETVVNGNENGKLEIYDMSGRRVEKMTKGLYIVNGQKVLVK